MLPDEARLTAHRPDAAFSGSPPLAGGEPDFFGGAIATPRPMRHVPPE
jgi:hypothetical protein